jgi:hypothetical protein
VGCADESLSRQGTGVDTAGLRMSQGVVLDKIAPLCHGPYLELEESDRDAVEIQHSLCHNLRLDTRPACVGHENLDSPGPDRTQGESGWVVSVGR